MHTHVLLIHRCTLCIELTSLALPGNNTAIFLLSRAALNGSRWNMNRGGQKKLAPPGTQQTGRIYTHVCKCDAHFGKWVPLRATIYSTYEGRGKGRHPHAQLAGMWAFCLAEGVGARADISHSAFMNGDIGAIVLNVLHKIDNYTFR